MIEIVKVVLEIIGKALSPTEVAKLRKEKKLRELGRELFLLYIHLNEILITGEQILKSLEIYISRMENHLARGDDKHALTAGSWIRHKIFKQSLSLRKFKNSVERFSNELQILDADSYRRLRPLLYDKGNVLSSLLNVMGQGDLPVLGPTASELLSLAEETRDKYDPFIDYLSFEKLQEVRSQITDTSIPSSCAWDEQIYEQVKNYLSTRNPRQQLDELKSILEQIRGALERNFSLQEILLEVGDGRLDSDYYVYPFPPQSYWEE